MARLPLASWRLKNSTCRKRFFASSNVRYGPPRFLPLLETTRYPFLCFLIISPSRTPSHSPLATINARWSFRLP